jgi:hypothetical protein
VVKGLAIRLARHSRRDEDVLLALRGEELPTRLQCLVHLLDLDTRLGHLSAKLLDDSSGRLGKLLQLGAAAMKIALLLLERGELGFLGIEALGAEVDQLFLAVLYGTESASELGRRTLQVNTHLLSSNRSCSFSRRRVLVRVRLIVLLSTGVELEWRVLLKDCRSCT